MQNLTDRLDEIEDRMIELFCGKDPWKTHGDELAELEAEANRLLEQFNKGASD